MRFNHLTERARNSDWFVNSFIMVVYDIFFKFNKNFLSKVLLKNFSQTTIVNQFAIQPEVRVLPVGSNNIH